MNEKWISAEERLPEDEKAVLVCYCFPKNRTGLRFAGILSYNRNDPEPHWQHESVGLRVTHWMPLPALPKDDENGKEGPRCR